VELLGFLPNNPQAPPVDLVGVVYAGFLYGASGKYWLLPPYFMGFGTNFKNTPPV
jgi:hypothetical protein